MSGAPLTTLRAGRSRRGMVELARLEGSARDRGDGLLARAYRLQRIGRLVDAQREARLR